jgi:ABC transporter, ATP-binding protein
VSGRTLRATLTCEPERLRGALADLQPREQVRDIEILGNTLTLSSTDTDTVAELLLSDHLAKDLEITSRGLEDAFVALTGDGTATRTPGASV